MPPTPTPEIVHIAGHPITVNGRYLRQRCAWCGAIILDYDLSTLAFTDDTPEEDRHPATWPVGDMIASDGGHTWIAATPDHTGNVETMPAQACAYLDPEATR